MFSLISVWINGWVNNRKADDLRRYRAHYDVIVMNDSFFIGDTIHKWLINPDDVVDTLRPRQNVRHFADDIFKCIFLNENVSIVIKISLKFVPKGPINNIPALVQIMAWRCPGDKALSEPILSVYGRMYASLGLNELIGYFGFGQLSRWIWSNWWLQWNTIEIAVTREIWYTIISATT